MGNHAEEDYFGLLFLKKNCDKTLKNIHAILSFSQCYKTTFEFTVKYFWIFKVSNPFSPLL